MATMRHNCEKHPHKRETYFVRDQAGYTFEATKRRGYCAGKWIAKPAHNDRENDNRTLMADSLHALASKVWWSERK